eukprot:gnl/MRDRNA2_/MRDRNA2_139223_c0_seq1.p1 gnl/MRDRNA2_/MRDRNA2_139223_c0~~gnl/MRDRNA2_/MRDRNA2_139223_c0_seq1.p1  ORF type:complete len:257 (-),score=28.46 gnl/MRDRNA2_/MRDRNA2_139223_c0_seq1:47-817(-)
MRRSRGIYDEDYENPGISPRSADESMTGREVPSLPSRMCSLRAAAVREAIKLLPTITPELLGANEPSSLPSRHKANGSASTPMRTRQENDSWVHHLPPGSPAGSSRRPGAASSPMLSERSSPRQRRTSPGTSPERSSYAKVNATVASRLGYTLAKAEQELASSTVYESRSTRVEESFESSESPPVSRGKFFRNTSGGLAGGSPGIQALLSLCSAGEEAGMQRTRGFRSDLSSFGGSPKSEKKVGRFGYPLLDSDDL